LLISFGVGCNLKNYFAGMGMSWSLVVAAGLVKGYWLWVAEK
jgi:hypothetical protein